MPAANKGCAGERIRRNGKLRQELVFIVKVPNKEIQLRRCCVKNTRLRGSLASIVKIILYKHGTPDGVLFPVTVTILSNNVSAEI